MVLAELHLFSQPVLRRRMAAPVTPEKDSAACARNSTIFNTK